MPAAELLEAADAIVRVFHRIGNRHNRAKARLKWAIDKIGAEAFLAEYRAEREKIRAEGGVPARAAAAARAAARAARRSRRSPAAEPGYDAWAADNVRPQKQAGFSSVVIRLILGDITAAQLRALAPLVVQFGEGELRTTNEQNLVLRWVPDARLPALHRELARIGLALGGANTLADVTSCPGASSCKLAVTASRGLAAQLTDAPRSAPRSGRARRAASTSRSPAARTAAASTTSPASAFRAACASSPAAPRRSTSSTSAAASAPTAPTSAA